MQCGQTTKAGTPCKRHLSAQGTCPTHSLSARRLSEMRRKSAATFKAQRPAAFYGQRRKAGRRGFAARVAQLASEAGISQQAAQERLIGNLIETGRLHRLANPTPGERAMLAWLIEAQVLFVRELRLPNSNQTVDFAVIGQGCTGNESLPWPWPAVELIIEIDGVNGDYAQRKAAQASKREWAASVGITLMSLSLREGE